MGLNAKSTVERLLFHSTPDGYPPEFTVVTENQIPLLPRVSLNDIPQDLVAFDDRRRAKDRLETGLHFYRDDRKFASPLLEPAKWVQRFSEFKCVLTPDVTIAKGMAPWLRISNTVHSRDVGAVWSHRGLTVVPSLRWISPEDFDFVFSGIEKGSVVAVSNYSSYREPEAKIIFEIGLDALLSELEPAGVMFFGKVYPRITEITQGRTNLFPFQPQAAILREKQSRLGAFHATRDTLFD